MKTGRKLRNFTLESRFVSSEQVVGGGREVRAYHRYDAIAAGFCRTAIFDPIMVRE
jgi:hypothetical protein